jgi:hypothetical protein
MTTTISRRCRVFDISTQDTAYQREMVKASVRSGRARPPCVHQALRLPTFTMDGMTLNKRLTPIITNGRIEQVFYPVSHRRTLAGDARG